MPPSRVAVCLMDSEWDEVDPVRLFSVGASMMVGVRLCLYPFSLIKTRLQAAPVSPAPSSPGGAALEPRMGVVGTAVGVVRAEGLRGLYRGFAMSAASTVPQNVLYLTTYESTRTALKPLAASLGAAGEGARGFLAGATASLVTQTLVVPVDVVVQRRMTEGGRRSTGAIVGDLWRSSGAAGFYRGYALSVATYGPSSAVWWGSFALYRDLAFGGGRGWGGEGGESAGEVALAAAMAGCTSATLTNPMDVVKTRVQLYGGNAREVLAAVVRADGPGGLFRGVAARIMNVVPMSVMVATGYKGVKEFAHVPRGG